MRKISTLVLLALLGISAAFAQSGARVSTPNLDSRLIPLGQDLKIQEPALQDAPQSEMPSIPNGTMIGEAVTAVKIAEASNAFTFILADNNQLVSYPSTNTVAFIHRQNNAPCGSTVGTDNGRYRAVYSNDGGFTWQINATSTNDPNSPTTTGCYGFGPLQPLYTQVSRYPNAVLFDKGTGDLALAYCGPVLLPGYPNVSGWDGVVAGGVEGLVLPGSTTSISEEYYNGANDSVYFAYSMTERVNGEFWFASRTYDATNQALLEDFKLFKGVYNSTNNTIDWTVGATIRPDYYLGFDGTATFAGGIALAFSPDGQIGYLASKGDLDNTADTVISVWTSRTVDGGLTWSDAEEIDINIYPGLKDSLQFFTDSLGNFTSVGTGNVVGPIDMAVDKKGNAHIIIEVANTQIFDNGVPTVKGYTFYPGLEKYVFDLTRDAFGDWNLMYLRFQNFYSASIGGASAITNDYWGQVSRSEDGKVIFFSWTDTDPANSSSGTDHDAPDLWGMAYDVDLQKTTDLENFTEGDPNWGTKAIMPKIAPVSFFDDTCTYTVPTVVMDLDDGEAGTPVLFWAFTDIQYDGCTDFTNDPQFFYNCKQSPISLVPTSTAPNCGVADGTISIAASGGLGSFSYQWDANAGNQTTPSVSGLGAGVYTVVVTDSLGCTQDLEINLPNLGAPTVNISSSTNVQCAGADDGTATAAVSGGVAPYTYTWDDPQAQSAATATGLAPGTYTVIVTDANSCENFSTVTITAPPSINLSASAADANCAGEASGSVTSFASGGTGVLAYEWNTNPVATTADVAGLSAGNYTVTITDENGCTEDQTVTVGQPSAIQGTFISAPNDQQMAPYSGVIVPQFAGGVGNYTYTLNIVDSIVVNGTDTTFLYGTSLFTDVAQSTFTGLIACKYELIVKDENGCTVTETGSVAVIDDGNGNFGAQCDPLKGVDTTTNDTTGGGVNIDFLNVGFLNIYPNPTSDAFTVSLEMFTAQSVTLEVFSYNGQLVERVEVPQTANVVRTFDLGSAANGIYLVKISTPEGSRLEKVMISK